MERKSAKVKEVDQESETKRESERERKSVCVFLLLLNISAAGIFEKIRAAPGPST